MWEVSTSPLLPLSSSSERLNATEASNILAPVRNAVLPGWVALPSSASSANTVVETQPQSANPLTMLTAIESHEHCPEYTLISHTIGTRNDDRASSSVLSHSTTVSVQRDASEDITMIITMISDGDLENPRSHNRRQRWTGNGSDFLSIFFRFLRSLFPLTFLSFLLFPVCAHSISRLDAWSRFTANWHSGVPCQFLLAVRGVNWESAISASQLWDWWSQEFEAF